MPPETIPFSRRAQPGEIPEWMDEPCTYPEFRACLVDLAKVNRVTLAARPTLQWLSQHAATADRPLHIVDVGCGGGDMLRHVAHWCRRKGIAVRLTGIDLNPYAARAAREFTCPQEGIEWITGDAYAYAPEQGIDIVLSSLFTHHLPDAELLQYLGWMERVAQRGWFINDLRRSAVSYNLFRLLATTRRWHPMVQHDGPVSIRRSFLESDWQTLCSRAGIAAAGLTVERKFPWRLCVGRWR